MRLFGALTRLRLLLVPSFSELEPGTAPALEEWAKIASFRHTQALAASRSRLISRPFVLIHVDMSPRVVPDIGALRFRGHKAERRSPGERARRAL